MFYLKGRLYILKNSGILAHISITQSLFKMRSFLINNFFVLFFFWQIFPLFVKKVFYFLPSHCFLLFDLPSNVHKRRKVVQLSVCLSQRLNKAETKVKLKSIRENIQEICCREKSRSQNYSVEKYLGLRNILSRNISV